MGTTKKTKSGARIGRPPTLPEDARGVALKMSAKTLKTLDRWAKADDITRNDLMRRELEALAERWEAEHPGPPPRPKKKSAE